MSRKFAAAAIVVFTALALSPLSAPAQENSSLNPAAAPPQILNIVYETFIPGKQTAYTNLEATIAHDYVRAGIPVYWYVAVSLTGPPRILSLNFLDSFAEAGQIIDALGSAMATHPDILDMQERLLSMVSDTRNSFAVRRDDIGYRADQIDFSKARFLRVATVVVRQGHEEEFEEAMKDLRAAYVAVGANSAWVLYQVNAGEPASTFVFFMPMNSLTEMDDYIARGRSLRHVEGDTIEARMQQIARSAYLSWDSELYIVNPALSQVPAAFAAGDPSFWSPKPTSSQRQH